MNQNKFVRIDSPVPKPDVKAPDVQPQKDHRFLPIVSVEDREKIIQYALQQLTVGNTTDAIGAEFNIDGSTLRRWLLSDESGAADKARKVYFDGELSEARESIKSSSDAFTLARAREDFKAVSWLAERRLSKFYGPKQEVTSIVQPVLNINVMAGGMQDSSVVVAESPNVALLPVDKSSDSE